MTVFLECDGPRCTGGDRPGRFEPADSPRRPLVFASRQLPLGWSYTKELAHLCPDCTARRYDELLAAPAPTRSGGVPTSGGLPSADGGPG